jgi:circadian clock protein KaiB
VKESWVLKLYISGTTSIGARARANLERLCAQHLQSHYRIVVVDLLQQPAAAREHEIVAVPTVVRENPAPIRKAIGDLSDPARVPSLFRTF